MPDHLIATAAFGLEAVVARELKDLGYADTRADAGRVRFVADRAAICRTNLWLRSADRVLVEMGSFPATDFGQLFDGAAALPWEEWLPADAAFPVRGKSVRSQLSSVPACQRLVKKAIAERLLKAHRVQNLPETGAEFQVEVSLLNDQVCLTLDTSGIGLHKRGYRPRSSLAPIKETLAAALIQLSYWRPDRPLLDPFCGSGTIPIEAALIGLNLAPGLNRAFAAEAWPAIPAKLWREARTEAQDRARRDVTLRIVGSDIDPGVLRLAQQHGKLAGVDSQIEWRQQDARDLRCEAEYGCIVTNPPYGERLGDQREVEELYRVLPAVLGGFPTWSHYVITSHPTFETIVGRPADRRRKLYNGRIECTYYQFHGPRPPKAGEEAPAPSLQAAFGGLPERAEEQAETFRRRLEKRAHHLRRWPTRQGITCYRLYDRDVPGVPLVVDRYEDCLHISEYVREDTHVAGQHDAWLQLMADTAADTLEVPRANTFFKARERQAGTTQHQRVADQANLLVAHEGGLQFEVNLSDYIDTGLFLDHRQTRELVRKLAAGKDVLNLFCYTGSFSVYAAAGGARTTCSVDLSATYLTWARRNFQLNGFTDERQHRLVRADVVAFLQELAPESCDLVVVDPPTFSNSKSTETVFDVQRDHRALLELTLRALRPGGICLFSTNRRKFKFEAADLELAADCREITNQTLPPDFLQQGAHRCWRLTRQ